MPAVDSESAGKVKLGERLYFDKQLSVDGTVSCATCHDPATAFADRNTVAIGIKGRRGTRNAPTILNASLQQSLFWDGRARSLEEQAKQPLVNQSEMGMGSPHAVVARVASLPEYPSRFRKAFGKEGITIHTIAKAIVAFERTCVSGSSPFDRFMAGEKRAMTEAQKRGWALFRGKARCITCHELKPSAPIFADFKFHNTGVATKGRDLEELARRAREAVSEASSEEAVARLAHTEGLAELGRYLVTKNATDIGAFKTPSLREVELTGPYMHDGSEKTLLDVVSFYNRGGEKNPHLDEKVRPLGLTESEIGELVEFLRALTSDEVMRQVQTSKPQTRQPVPLPAH